MPSQWRCPPPPIRGVLATMHGKERVIAPLVQRALGVHLEVPNGFDTDRFGTFSREVPRKHSAIETARAKIIAALEQIPRARVGLASEGSFGPHPQVPFLPFDSELVVLRDRNTGLEVVGHHATPRTNYASRVVEDVQSAMDFADSANFPACGMLVMGAPGGRPDPQGILFKDIGVRQELKDAVCAVLARCGTAHVETDMRAHRNPLRMRAIRRATIDLIRAYRMRCPNCDRPGFVVTGYRYGLSCSTCGQPTRQASAGIRICAGCAFRSERAIGPEVADPARCDFCNP